MYLGLNTLGLQCLELVGNCCFSALPLSGEMAQLEPIFQPLGPAMLGRLWSLVYLKDYHIYVVVNSLDKSYFNKVEELCNKSYPGKIEKIVETEGNGNCSFSSVYRAIHHGQQLNTNETLFMLFNRFMFAYAMMLRKKGPFNKFLTNSYFLAEDELCYYSLLFLNKFLIIFRWIIIFYQIFILIKSLLYNGSLSKISEIAFQLSHLCHTSRMRLVHPR